MIDLQVEMDDCPSLVNCQFFETYKSLHDDPEMYDNGLCDECHDSLAAPWTILCHDCDEYFGSIDNRNRYNYELRLERGYFEPDYSDCFSSDEESSCW